MQHRVFCGAAQIKGDCLDSFLRKFADVDPLARVRAAKQLDEVELNGAAGAADGGKNGLEALHTDVEIHGDGLIDPEGTDAAHRVADQLKNLVGGEHLGLHVKLVFELVVVDPGVARGEDQHAALRRFERERFRDAGALHAESQRGQLDRGGGDGEFDDPILDPEGTEIGAAFLYGHVLPLKK